MGKAGLKPAALVALALAGCAPTYPIAPPRTAQPPPASAPPQTPTPAPPPRTPAPTPPAATAADACGAAQLQRLVGRPRSEIPVPVDPSRQRVACTTCPVTQDYNPARLNFFFDAQTGVIREVRCG